MSIVIITLGDAPKVSEEVIRSEAELDALLERRIKGM